jgi:hypothetical protein
VLNKIILVISFTIFIALSVQGQSMPKEYWKEIANYSEAIVVGTVEEDYRVIRPEKFKPNSDNSFPTESEIYVGRVFRVKITKKLKGKIETEKFGENKYANIFLYWISGIPGIGKPKLLKGKEYVLFLVPNNDKELEGKETVEFRPNNEIIRKPFDYKSSYLVAEGFRGTVEIKTDKKKLITEIKRAI